MALNFSEAVSEILSPRLQQNKVISSEKGGAVESWKHDVQLGEEHGGLLGWWGGIPGLPLCQGVGEKDGGLSTRDAAEDRMKPKAPLPPALQVSGYPSQRKGSRVPPSPQAKPLTGHPLTKAVCS